MCGTPFVVRRTSTCRMRVAAVSAVGVGGGAVCCENAAAGITIPATIDRAEATRSVVRMGELREWRR